MSAATEPRSYCVGLPVVVTVADDGAVTYHVDTAEAGQAVSEEDWYNPADVEAIEADHARRWAAAQAAADLAARGEQTWTFVGHWDNDEIVVEYILPGEQQDPREDTGEWEQGLFAASASGTNVAEAESRVRDEYEGPKCSECGKREEDTEPEGMCSECWHNARRCG